MPRVKKQRLKRRRDGRYACRYKDQWFYGASEEEALAQREEYKRLEKLQASAPVSVADYAGPFLERIKEGASDSTIYIRNLLMKKLTKAYGQKLLPEVTPSMMKELYSSKFAGLSQHYISHAKTLYIAFFDAAVDDQLITVNPARAKSAKPHKGYSKSHRAITPQERFWIDNLCLDHPLRPVVITMLYAGLRPQEAKAMDIDRNFDLEKLEIRIDQTVHHVGKSLGHYVIDSNMKTEKSARTVPIFPPVEEAIRGRHGMLVPFPDDSLSENDWTRLWRSYRIQMETAINGMTSRVYLNRSKKEKLPPFIRFTVTPYDLRHSFATWCRDFGVELHTVIEWMGHSDSKMILKIYDEVSEDRNKKEAEKLIKSAFRSQNGSQSKNEEARKP